MFRNIKEMPKLIMKGWEKCGITRAFTFDSNYKPWRLMPLPLCLATTLRLMKMWK
jgi:hypothetical protein